MGLWLFDVVRVAVLASLTVGVRLAERTSLAQQNLGPRKVEMIGERPPMTLRCSSATVAWPYSEPARLS
jgi:hypothetical protein